MKFTPRTENEIAADKLLPPGLYGFEIIDAEDTTSKAGNDMIKLTVHVYNGDGAPVTIFDYLMERIAYKLRHAAETCGLLGEYESGALNAIDFKGKTGRCKVVIQQDKNGQYPDKNSIADYVRADSAPVARVRVAGGGDSIDDDSIPFGPCYQ